MSAGPLSIVAPGGAECRGKVATIALCLPRGHVRHWHRRLADRLCEIGTTPRVVWAERDEPSPAGMDSLFALERALRPRAMPRPSDRVDPAILALTDLVRADGDVVQLVLPGAAEVAGTGPIWHVLFDGQPGEAALLQALLGGVAPAVEIANGDGFVIARARPSLEAAANLCEAYEAVMIGLVAAVAMAATSTTPPASISRPPALRRSLSAYALRRLSHGIARRLYHLCFHAPHWRTGWRFTRGSTVWDTGSLGGAPWRVLADPGHRFFADPFPFRWQDTTHLFVEDLDHRTGRGAISVVAFGPDGPVGPVTPVLEERFHLSYPFILAHGGQVWMIPETSENRTVSLYRADPYPSRWVHDRDLLTNIAASDATLVRHEGQWWMFVTLYGGEGSHSDTLGLFMADDLFGPWRPHPANPVLIDAGSARPAGGMIVRNGRLWRPVQDCTRLYGGGMALCEVTTLTDMRFEQVVRARLGPCAAWPGRRLHTLNCTGGIEVIDGSALSPKLFRSVTGGNP
ncbi:hypothetical protein FV222_04555 [Methylobacterium sp. WL103]|uniref:glucosamine inositolphosphorylceramide transferase family protein n=1 Tax=Methylobacterium sp. WL103 TaxID=2603891 RepID=UPI0011C781C8|nr:hypothetical protein [Methylobacterium sp. WL103]TXN06769.1 hypothetical protein FV222_04555 [Methylobacterium sp. WL103]